MRLEEEQRNKKEMAEFKRQAYNTIKQRELDIENERELFRRETDSYKDIINQRSNN